MVRRGHRRARHVQGRRTGIGCGPASLHDRGTARRPDGGRGALPASTVQAVNRLVPLSRLRPALRTPPWTFIEVSRVASGLMPGLVPGPMSPRLSTAQALSRVLPVVCLAAACGLAPGRAEAQVSRCVDRQGNSVFTDRPCEAVDSASRVPPAARAGGRGSAYRGACARSLPMLIRDLSSAIQSGDANRLGMLYLWAGVSDAEALRTLNRLQSIAERPLVDIVPLRREIAVAVASPTAPASAAGGASAEAAAPVPAASAPRAMHWDGDGAPGAPRTPVAPRPDPPAAGPAPGPAAAPTAGFPPPQTRIRSVVTGLRLQQTAGKRATSVAVVLGLRRAYDCWWISLPAG